MRKRRNKKFKANKYDKLVIDIKNNLITRLGDLMLKLLNSAPDKIFTLADNAASNEDQNRYFDLMNKLRSLKSDIANSYISHVKTCLVPASELKSGKNKTTGSGSNELSLVGQDEMEGMVLVKSIGDRANARYREQLSHLEARLEHLALKSNSTFTNKALMPTNFCQAFEDSINEYFSNADKKILFSMFESEVTNKLESVYDSINNRLIDAEILPQIKLNVSTQRRRHNDRITSENAGDELTIQKTDKVSSTDPNQHSRQAGLEHNNAAPVSHGAYAMTASPGGTYHQPSATNQQPAANQIQSQQAVSAESSCVQSQASGHSGQTRHADSKQFMHYTAGIPAQQVGQALGGFLGTPVTPETVTEQSHQSGGAFFPASTSQAFGHQEILQALSSLQALPQFIQPEQTRFDAEAIKQAVIKELASETGGVVTKRINQIAEKTIDFIKLIFDAIIDDEDISDTIKTLLLRLQIPIIKASMSDQEFFIYDDHPARVLLDKIAEVGIGVSHHKDEMYRHLDRIISTLLTEYELTTDTFQTALESLEQIIEQQEELARKHEEEAQQQTLRGHARNTVLKALRAITTGKTLPEAVHPLILKRWPTLMFNHYLQYGKENDEWVNLIETLRDIIESIQPIKSAEDLAILQADKDEILEITHDYLAKAIKSKKDIKNVLHGLSQTYDKHIAEADFSSEELEAAEESIMSIEDETDDDDIIANAASVTGIENTPAIPDHATPGTWFQLYMGDDQIDRRCKLSVVIIEDANMMFVNHKGELIVEKSFDAFNAEMSSGKTRLIMGHSAFDHALKTVVTQLPQRGA